HHHAARVPVVPEIAQHVNEQRQPNRPAHLPRASIHAMNRKPRAGPDESSHARATLDPTFALQVIQRPPNRRAAQPRDSSQLMIRKKALAGTRLDAKKVIQQLLAQRRRRPAWRQGMRDLKALNHGTTLT